jgi:hypothetical protein
MDRPRLLPRQAEVVEQPQHAVLGVADAETILDDLAEILGPPSADAVTLRVGAAQHQRLQRRELPLVEPRRATAPGPVAQAFDAFGVEPDDPIAQGLAVHAGLAGGALAAHPIHHVGEANQSACHPAIALLPRQPAQLFGGMVVTDRYGCAHG